MEVKISSFEPQQIIKTIAQKMRVKLTSEGAEVYMSIPARIGEGVIKGIDFLDGIGFTYVTCQFKKDTVFHFESEKPQPIRFIFCLKGELFHILDPDNFRYKLSSMIGSIATSSNSNKQLFILPANKEIAYFTLDINKEKFFPKIEKELDTVPEKLADVFKDTKSLDHFLYQADYSLNISECLYEIENNDHEGMVRRIFLESKALDLLWMQIKQYKDDQNTYSQQTVLRKSDIELIMKAKKILVKDLQNSPSINELAKLTGTNPTKLKKGFKRLYDCTINEYLRNERLKKAKLLLAQESLSIKEISEVIGYKNKSVFAKRFKEKFGVLPSTFMNRYKSESVK